MVMDSLWYSITLQYLKAIEYKGLEVLVGKRGSRALYCTRTKKVEFRAPISIPGPLFSKKLIGVAIRKLSLCCCNSKISSESPDMSHCGI